MAFDTEGDVLQALGNGLIFYNGYSVAQLRSYRGVQNPAEWDSVLLNWTCMQISIVWRHSSRRAIGRVTGILPLRVWFFFSWPAHGQQGAQKQDRFSADFLLCHGRGRGTRAKAEVRPLHRGGPYQFRMYDWHHHRQRLLHPYPINATLTRGPSGTYTVQSI